MGSSQTQRPCRRDSERTALPVAHHQPSARASLEDDEYGEGLPSGLVGKSAGWITIALFACALLGTATVDSLWPAEEVQLVGAERQAQERSRAQAAIWDGSLARGLEDQLRARSRVRESVMPWYAFQLFKLFDEGVDGVLVGEDHWMFLERRCELRPFSDEVLAASRVNSVIALDRRLAARDIELTVLPIPRKSYVARELLPRGQDGRSAVDDLLILGLLRKGVETVDLRDEYRGVAPEEIYLKLDTHWTPEAARIAAREIAATAGLPRDGREPMGRLGRSTTQADPLRNVATLVSIGARPSVEDLAGVVFVHPPKTRIQLPPEVHRWFRAPTPSSPIALAGTSFSHQQQLAQVLTHYAGEPVFDSARPAQPHMTTLAQLLEAYEGARPLERVVWEFPIAVIFDECTNRSIRHGLPEARAFAAVPPLRPQTVLRVAPGPSLQGKGRRAKLITVPAGRLAHSGDGVLDLLVEGQWDGPRCEITLQCGNTATLHALTPGPFSLSFPVLDSSPTAAGLTLAVTPARGSELRLSSAEFTINRLGPITPLEASTGEEQIVLTPATPAQALGRRPAVLIELAENEVSRPSPVQVEIWTEGAERPRRVQFYGVRPGATLALDLGPESGARLASIALAAAHWQPLIDRAELHGGS